MSSPTASRRHGHSKMEVGSNEENDGAESYSLGARDPCLDCHCCGGAKQNGRVQRAVAPALRRGDEVHREEPGGVNRVGDPLSALGRQNRIGAGALFLALPLLMAVLRMVTLVRMTALMGAVGQLDRHAPVAVAADHHPRGEAHGPGREGRETEQGGGNGASSAVHGGWRDATPAP